MPQLILILLVAALVFGVCYLIDRAFTKIFRSKAQQRSGLAVRTSKRYGVFGVIFTALGTLGLTTVEKPKERQLMPQLILILLVAALVFGVCYLIDRAFTKIFRSKAQQRSGLAVRTSKRYGVFGVIFTALGVLAICVGVTDGPVLLFGGIFVLLM